MKLQKSRRKTNQKKKGCGGSKVNIADYVKIVKQSRCEIQDIIKIGKTTDPTGNDTGTSISSRFNKGRKGKIKTGSAF